MRWLCAARVLVPVNALVARGVRGALLVLLRALVVRGAGVHHDAAFTPRRAC